MYVAIIILHLQKLSMKSGPRKLKMNTFSISTPMCSCWKWQTNGYPCRHGLTIILSNNKNPQEYVKQFYTLDAYKNTYATPIFYPFRDAADFTQLPRFDEVLIVQE